MRVNELETLLLPLNLDSLKKSFLFNDSDIVGHFQHEVQTQQAVKPAVLGIRDRLDH
jgi:hypothetical protein